MYYKINKIVIIIESVKYYTPYYKKIILFKDIHPI